MEGADATSTNGTVEVVVMSTVLAEADSSFDLCATSWQSANSTYANDVFIVSAIPYANTILDAASFCRSEQVQLIPCTRTVLVNTSVPDGAIEEEE